MAKKPNTPAAPTAAPAPETTQEHAGAGETQVTHFRIAARTDGFRRCGRAWPAAGVEVAAEDLAEGDIERLRAELELVVTPVAQGVA